MVFGLARRVIKHRSFLEKRVCFETRSIAVVHFGDLHGVQMATAELRAEHRSYVHVYTLHCSECEPLLGVYEISYCIRVGIPILPSGM